MPHDRTRARIARQAEVLALGPRQAPVSKGGAGGKAAPADAGLPQAPGTPPATPTAKAAASSHGSRLSDDTAYDTAEAVQPLDDMRPVSDAQSCRTSARARARGAAPLTCGCSACG